MKDKDFPNALTITMNPGSFFGEADIAEIRRALGLDAGDISSSCTLSANGKLQTSMGEREIYGGLSPQLALRYEGQATGISLTARALCRAEGNLPEGGDPVTMIDDRFVVSLQSFSCPPPPTATAVLSVTYEGGMARCGY